VIGTLHSLAHCANASQTDWGKEVEGCIKLLTQELRRKLPKLYSQENETDPIIVCKFFTPDAGWTWYAIEFDGKDTFFGYVVGIEPELGYFTLSELAEVRGVLGLPVERDLWFRPIKLSEVKKLHNIRS
jgi:hypothetical protein